MTFQTIEITVAPRRFMRWHERLRDRLARRWPQAKIAFRFVEEGDSWPVSARQLLALESLLLRKRTPALSDFISPGAAAAAQKQSQRDVVIDLAGADNIPAGLRVLRPLYDGHASDQFAVISLLAGNAPTLELQDAASGAIIAQGFPSLEAADGLTGGLEAVYSRMIVLIEKALADPRPVADAAVSAEKNARTPLSFALRNLAFQCARQIYHLCCHSPHWRVGWRFVDGADTFDSGALTGKPWRVMQDREMCFAADPFPIEWRGRSGVFFERLDYRSNRGEIYFQEFDSTGPTGQPVPALIEPWHLSYPFLVPHEGELYMLPEASASGGVTLYRCVEFPGKWEPVARILDDVEAADATIFRHADRFWMTSVVREGAGGYSDTLALHHASSIFGPWEPHARNPVLIDSRYARPAGAVVIRDGALYRPVQDCSNGYGKRIVIMRIDELDEHNFRQTPMIIVEPGAGWPGSRLHTLNRWGRLECIDGAIFTPKSLSLRKTVHAEIDSRALKRGETRENLLAPALP